MLSVTARELALRVDRDARPAKVSFEVVGRARLLPVIGPDVDEEAVASVVEEVTDDQLFIEL